MVAVTDFMKLVPDQVARFVPQPFTTLGTDGYGRSDTRPALRRYFQVDGPSVVLATLIELARRDEVKAEAPRQAIEKYGLAD